MVVYFLMVCNHKLVNVQTALVLFLQMKVQESIVS